MKKKKISRKPVSRSKTEEPHSIQDVATGQAANSTENIDKPEEEKTDLIEPQLQRSDETSNNGEIKKDETNLQHSSWAEETEKEDYQSSAQRHWAKLKEDQQSSVAAKLHYEEPMLKSCKRVTKIDLNEVAKQAQNWNTPIVCMVKQFYFS
ncbi:hypothetical protein CsatB_004270 [Cannabis sativa]